jgi:hypothetical protein
VLIILSLAVDEFSYSYFPSKKLAVQIKEAKDVEGSYRSIQWLLDSFVSFKTMLYLFYIFILLISQIIDFYPDSVLAGGGFGNFILINRYNIVLLIAIDKLIKHFAKDRERMDYASAELKKNLAEGAEGAADAGDQEEQSQ